MSFSSELSSRLRSLTRKKYEEIDDADLFMSAQAKEHLSRLARAITGRVIEVNIVALGPDGPVACTDGDMITINCETDIVTRYTQTLDRWTAFMGILYHELAHILFTDFKTENKAFCQIAKGEFFGPEPETENDAEKDMLSEMKDAMLNPVFSPVFTKIFHDLENTFTDKHDEDAIMGKYRGMCQSGIMLARESLLNSFGLFDDLQAKIGDGKTTELQIFYSALLQYSRFGEIALSDPELWNTSGILSVLRECSYNIELATWTDNYEERYGALNQVAFRIWKFIQKYLEALSEVKKSSGGSNQTSGIPQTCAGNNLLNNVQNPQEPPQLTQEELQQAVKEIIEQLNQASGDSRMSVTPKNQKSTGNSKPSSVSNDPKKNPSGSEKASASVAVLMQDIKESMASDNAIQELEKELAVSLNANIRAVNMNGGHKGVPLVAYRELDTSQKELYETIMSDIRITSGKLQKSIREALSEVKQGSAVRHKPYGNRLEIRDVYRPDGLCYSRTKLPLDPPDMAISVLVDNSGSMHGDRISAAIRSAVLLYDFATAIGIPVSVAGHCTDDDNVLYTTYADFERVSNCDRLRICSMYPHGCNRDGMALTIAGDLLSKRSEDVKLLFIISDGKPNHNNYGGEEAAKDIREIIRKYRNLGVEIISAGIGDDRDSLRPIYGDTYLDIADLSRLPKTAASIVSKRILEAIR